MCTAIVVVEVVGEGSGRISHVIPIPANDLRVNSMAVSMLYLT